mmetsp:Transcript_22329/g.19227  ORF Transcript_22329/g.19227 Transcript_22329/m.19227 type:complete len:162 (+) Transcript_22329:397-882(+)
MIKEMQKNRNLIFYCDLHGHSRKKNAFFYGNATKESAVETRIFPMILSKMSKYVSFEDSRFAVQKAKESTARIALWRELGIDNVFTLEGSFYGYIQDKKTIPFTAEDFINIGKDMCKALFIYVTQVTMKGTSPSKEVFEKSFSGKVGKEEGGDDDEKSGFP